MRRHRSYLNGKIRQLIRYRDFLANQLKRILILSHLKQDLKLAQIRVKSRIRQEAKEQASQALTALLPLTPRTILKELLSLSEEVKTNLSATPDLQSAFCLNSTSLPEHTTHSI